MSLSTMRYAGQTIYYRKGKNEAGSDFDAIQEVLEKKQYANKALGRQGFDVEPGERWLDLGANIGAFAVYCKLRGATAVCYEPDPECFEILRKNAPHFDCVNKAVTAQATKTLRFRISNNPDNHWRGTVCPTGVPARYVDAAPVANLYAGELACRKFDGIKMDIEGSEHDILDAKLLPECSKLVLEYHSSRDSSLAHLRRRVDYLRGKFDHVHLTDDMRDGLARENILLYNDVAPTLLLPGKDGEGKPLQIPFSVCKEYRPQFDQLIFAWNN